jgi:phage-related protein
MKSLFAHGVHCTKAVRVKPPFKAVYYRTQSGSEPVRDYIDDDKKPQLERQKIHDIIARIRDYGEALGEPYVKQVSGPIYELRDTVYDNRILFVKRDQRMFVLLHAIKKKRWSIKPKDIQVAQTRWEDLERRFSRRPYRAAKAIRQRRTLKLSRYPP